LVEIPSWRLVFQNVTAFNIRQMTPIENPENVESKAQAIERV